MRNLTILAVVAVLAIIGVTFAALSLLGSGDVEAAKKIGKCGRYNVHEDGSTSPPFPGSVVILPDGGNAHTDAHGPTSGVHHHTHDANHLIFGGDGIDVIHGADKLFRFDLICGGGGIDDIRGFNGDDHLFGGPGNDSIQGGGQNDHLSGGPGADLLQGLSGNDILTGGPGNDTLDGGPGNDILTGGSGDDHFVPGTGTDVCNGSSGTDHIHEVDTECETISNIP